MNPNYENYLNQPPYFQSMLDDWWDKHTWPHTECKFIHPDDYPEFKCPHCNSFNIEFKMNASTEQEICVCMGCDVVFEPMTIILGY